MITTKPALKIEEAVKIAKPFIGSLAGKNIARVVLKTALVTEKYVIATNSHFLIRLQHEGMNKEPYLFHYKKELTGAYDAGSYPKIDRLIPDPYNAQNVYTINIKEWLAIHEAGSVAAKEHKNDAITLLNNRFEVQPVTTKAVKSRNKNDYSSIVSMKGYKDVSVDPFNQISFNHTLDENTNIERVRYNCSYMITILKAIKKLQHSSAKLYFYGPLRPMLFVAEGIEVILLPVR